ALAVQQQILRVDPGNVAAERALALLAKSLPDPAAALPPADLALDLAREKIAEQDAKHAEWTKAWVEKTPHGTVKTDAGYVMLKAVAAALGAAQPALAAFFPRAEGAAPLPKLEARVFASRDEYERLGQSPPP